MILKLKTAPTVEPVTLTEVLRQVRLDVTAPELSSGTLTIGQYYLITATTSNYFGTGLAVGDTFLAAAATALSSTCKVQLIPEGPLLNSYIKAARMHIENLCGPLITQTWYQYEDDWPTGDVLSLGKARIQSVTAVKYTDVDSVTATLASTNYAIDDESEYSPRIVLEDDGEWPSDDLHPKNPIEIEFVCGYGATASTVPEPVRLAILLLVSHWYEHREPVLSGVSAAVVPLPFVVDCLISNYRVWGF